MAIAANSTIRSRLMVASTSCSDSPTTSTAPGTRTASTRYRPDPEMLAAVNASPVRRRRDTCAALELRAGGAVGGHVGLQERPDSGRCSTLDVTYAGADELDRRAAVAKAGRPPAGS